MNNLAANMIPDVQNFADNRHMAIQQVGIKAIRHPVRIINNAGEEQATVARVSMDVSLPAHLKGTHMSRFIALLNEPGPALSAGRLDALLREMAVRLEAQEGRIELSFPCFVKKAAPVSGVESLLDYQVTLTGTIVDGTVNMETQVVIAATSLCPCSKEISQYGAHNQRSHITVTVQADPDLGLEELIAMVEAQASCEVYGLLKRPDEKYVTERAYDNPKFVEDMVRDVAIRLAGDARITAYDVLVENFESIHNHSAFARIRSR